MTFSKKLRELRKKNRLNQDELAYLINQQTGKTFTRTTISNYETGHSSPSLDLIPQIAKIFGVTLDELMGSDEPSDTSTHVIPNDLNTEYPDYPKQGSSQVYEDAVSYGYRQDELIIKIREDLNTMAQTVEQGKEDELRDQLKIAIEILTDLTTKYHDQTHKLVDSYQRSNRLAEMLKAPYKL